MGSSGWLNRRFLRIVQKAAGKVPVRISENSPVEAGHDPAIIIKDPQVLRSMVLHPELGFCDGYAHGQIEVKGDLACLLESVYHQPRRATTRVLSRWLNWLQANTLSGSLRNIHYHYDLSNNFYRLWLDRQMLYTCAWFSREDSTLEEAQTAKMELVCRKLWLRPGETVVEAGCGWGALALHMARNYGVRVKAFNISHEQIAFARERAREEGLDSQVEFIEDDCRNISGRFDAFVSVGMLEHLGKANYREFGRVIRRTIGDSGRGFLHFIGRSSPQPFSVWIRKRIFPGAHAPSIQEAMNVLEPEDFSVLHIENLRPHYAKTLEHWLSRFEGSYQAVVECFGPVFARMWRLYLAGSLAAFRVGGLQLFQIVFAGKKCGGQPWAWSDLYSGMTEEIESEPKWIRAIS
jgi:cyclopropane-fatty-acyl-phospholipid synthase